MPRRLRHPILSCGPGPSAGHREDRPIARARFASTLVALLLAGLLPAGVGAAGDNQPPIAIDDPGPACAGGPAGPFGGSFPVEEDADLAGWSASGPCSVGYNDSDPDGDALAAYELVRDAAHGELTFLEDGFWSYVPDPDYSTPPGQWVSDSFTYRVSDGTAWSEPAQVSLWLAPLNDAPSFTPGPALIEVDEDGGAYSARWATNIKPGPAHEDYQNVAFQVATDDAAAFSVPPVISPSGVLSFTPAPNTPWLSEITVTLKDDGGLESYSGVFATPDDTSDSVTFHVAVHAVDDAAVAGDDSVTVAEDSAETFVEVLANDGDEEGDLFAVTAVSDPGRGSAAVAPGGAGVSYTPDPDAFGQDTFTYTIDGGDTGLVTVTITGANDPPVIAGAGDVTVAEDSGVTTIVGWAAGSSPGAGEAGQPVTWTIDVEREELFAAGPAVLANGALSFTPAAHAWGSTDMTVTLADGFGATDTTTSTITVSPVNDPPTAQDDLSMSVPEGAAPTALPVLANDSGSPDPGETVTITSVAQPANGTVAITGGGTGLTYRPAALFDGVDTFSYAVSDGHGGTDTATVKVRVVRDAAPPSVALGTPWIRTGVALAGPTSVSVGVQWSGADPGSGISTYQVQHSLNGGAFVAVPLPRPTATSVARTLSTTATHQFRVRAIDGEGNVSAWRTGPLLRPTVYQEATSLATWTGPWTSVAQSSASAGRVRYATSPSSSVTFRFNGRGVAFVAPRFTSSGRVRIYVDHVLAAMFDLDTTRSAAQQVNFQKSFATSGSHTLRVQVYGDGRVDADAFVVLR